MPANERIVGAYVDDVGELGAQPTGLLDAIRPVDDHGVAGPAEVRAHLLPPLEGRVPGPRPGRGVMGVHNGGSPLVEPAVAFGQLELHLVGERDAVLHRELVERPRDRPLHARSVVAPDPKDERIAELTKLLNGVDDAADVVVGVLRVPGVDLHLAGVEDLEVFRYVIPRREGVGAWRQLGAGGDHPELLLAGEGLLAEAVPSLVELPLVLVCPPLRHVVGGMATAGGEVDKEGLVGVLGAHSM